MEIKVKNIAKIYLLWDWPIEEMLLDFQVRFDCWRPDIDYKIRNGRVIIWRK